MPPAANEELPSDETLNSLPYQPALATVASNQPSSATNSTAKPLPEPDPKRFPIVIMEQTAANGKVLYFEDNMSETTPAAMVPVEIWTEVKPKRIYKTVTDRDGGYSFPALDANIYRMRVGRLQLKLEVTPRGNEGGLDAGQKVILIYIPRELGVVAGSSK